MIFDVRAAVASDRTFPVTIRCPACRQLAMFHPLTNVFDMRAVDLVFGQRRCPNPECGSHVFMVFRTSQDKLVVAYPSERIDFDAAGIPAPVVTALEEAITCHANRCFTAAAIMVRKTLEELCRDRGATGKNLKDRIQSLESKLILPRELFEGLDHLRLLGNDAAHIESKEYEQVGQEEVEIGVMVTKEVLKSVYQYSSLVDRLRALKKSS